MYLCFSKNFAEYKYITDTYYTPLYVALVMVVETPKNFIMSLNYTNRSISIRLNMLM